MKIVHGAVFVAPHPRNIKYKLAIIAVCLMRRGKDIMLAHTTCSELWNIQRVDLLRDLLMKCLFYVLI